VPERCVVCGSEVILETCETWQYDAEEGDGASEVFARGTGRRTEDVMAMRCVSSPEHECGWHIANGIVEKLP